MPMFTYKAIDARGARQYGRAEAANLTDLEQRLSRIGLDLVVGALSLRPPSSLGREKVKRPDLINFCFHLEQLSQAGVPILESLVDLRDSMEPSRFREVVAGLIESIQGGSNLSSAMAIYPETFSTVFVSLVRSGEQTGRLPEVLRSVTETLKWEDELAAHTKKILLYPAFVGAVVVGITFFLMIYLVPQMAVFIRTMGQDAPLQTRLLFSVSGFFVDFWWAILAVPVAIWLGLSVLARTSENAAYAIDHYKISMPVLGPILRKIILSRFAASFAMMYASGITILDAIRSCEDIVGNQPLRDALRTVGQRINEGTNLTGAFEELRLFPPLVLRMLRVGESTGALNTALLNVSYFYNREVRESIARFQALLEPMLTIILGLILGWVMLAVLGPVYDAVSKLKF